MKNLLLILLIAVLTLGLFINGCAATSSTIASSSTILLHHQCHKHQ